MTHDNTQSDVVEQLRAYKPYQISDSEPFGPKFCEQAADEIERLRSALASLTKDSDAVLEERERCARIADEHTPGGEYYEREYDSFTADSIAAAIRRETTHDQSGR